MKILISTLVVLASGAGLGHVVHDAGANRSRAPQAFEAAGAGEQHLMLQKLAGTWDAIVVMQDPKGVEVRTKGLLTTSKHADFHTIDSFQGDVMGMPMSGHGINGYCTVRKQFFTFWTDSMSASPMTLFGDYDAIRRELTLTGECLGMSGKLETCRTVTHYADDDHRSWSMYGPGPDGREMRHLRIDYTRRK